MAPEFIRIFLDAFCGPSRFQHGAGASCRNAFRQCQCSVIHAFPIVGVANWIEVTSDIGFSTHVFSAEDRFSSQSGFPNEGAFAAQDGLTENQQQPSSRKLTTGLSFGCISSGYVSAGIGPSCCTLDTGASADGFASSKPSCKKVVHLHSSRSSGLSCH